MSSDLRHGDDFRVLHTLRCIGASTSDRISTASGVAPVATGDSLESLSTKGLVSSTGGPFGGWAVTDVGRSTDDDELTTELAHSATRPAVRSVYERFLELNPGLLQLCTDWQMQMIGTTPVLNDHTDDEYDARVLTQLLGIHTAAHGLCRELSSALHRFNAYESRFNLAIEQAMAGRNDYVADRFDSYHSVWFQLHEDLLTTLGISREEERRGRHTLS